MLAGHVDLVELENWIRLGVHGQPHMEALLGMGPDIGEVQHFHVAPCIQPGLTTAIGVVVFADVDSIL